MAFISYDDSGNVSIRSIYNKFTSLNSSQMVPEKTSKTNLYIKGLPVYFNDSLLKDLVLNPSTIRSVKVAVDEENRCRGYGFIDFFSKADAEDAKSHMEQNFPNYLIKYAKENEKDKSNLYVTNIPKSWSNADNDKLKNVFERYGQVQSAFIMVEKSTNKSSGIGFVRFSNEVDAERALDMLKMNKVFLPGCDQPLEAKFADKHNPDSRKRRSIAETSLKQNQCNIFCQPGDSIYQNVAPAIHGKSASPGLININSILQNDNHYLPNSVINYAQLLPQTFVPLSNVIPNQWNPSVCPLFWNEGSNPNIPLTFNSLIFQDGIPLVDLYGIPKLSNPAYYSTLLNNGGQSE